MIPNMPEIFDRIIDLPRGDKIGFSFQGGNLNVYVKNHKLPYAWALTASIATNDTNIAIKGGIEPFLADLVAQVNPQIQAVLDYTPDQVESAEPQTKVAVQQLRERLKFNALTGQFSLT